MTATPDIDAMATELWQELLDKDDRTSPEDYPDMALITRDELVDFLHVIAEAERDRLRERVAVLEMALAEISGKSLIHIDFSEKESADATAAKRLYQNWSAILQIARAALANGENRDG
jgi:hypothetical protein